MPVNPKVLGEKALQTMPEIIQVLFKSNDPNLLDKNLERKIYEKLGTESEYEKLVELDKRIQEKYIELDNGLYLPTIPSGISYSYAFNNIRNIKTSWSNLNTTIKLLESLNKILNIINKSIEWMKTHSIFQKL